MKKVTFIAVISIIIKIVFFIISIIILSFSSDSEISLLFQGFSLVDVLSFAGLLPFFIKLYKKQSDEI
jgi:hypothetical protein